MVHWHGKTVTGGGGITAKRLVLYQLWVLFSISINKYNIIRLEYKKLLTWSNFYLYIFSGLISTNLFFFAGKFRLLLNKHLKKWIKSKNNVMQLDTLNLDFVFTQKIMCSSHKNFCRQVPNFDPKNRLIFSPLQTNTYKIFKNI